MAIKYLPPAHMTFTVVQVRISNPNWPYLTDKTPPPSPLKSSRLTRVDQQTNAEESCNQSNTWSWNLASSLLYVFYLADWVTLCYHLNLKRIRDILGNEVRNPGQNPGHISKIRDKIRDMNVTCLIRHFFPRYPHEKRLFRPAIIWYKVGQVKKLPMYQVNFSTLGSYIYPQTIIFYIASLGKINLFSGEYERKSKNDKPV